MKAKTYVETKELATFKSKQKGTEFKLFDKPELKNIMNQQELFLTRSGYRVTYFSNKIKIRNRFS